MTQAWGRGADCMEWFETRLWAEAALRTRCRMLPTDQRGMCPSGTTPAWCARGQGACSRASPSCPASGCGCCLLCSLGAAQRSCLFQAAEDRCWESLPSLSPSHVPSLVPLAPQPGGPCSPQYMPPPWMLCEVSSVESWGFQRVFQHMLWQILL